MSCGIFEILRLQCNGSPFICFSLPLSNVLRGRETTTRNREEERVKWTRWYSNFFTWYSKIVMYHISMPLLALILIVKLLMSPYKSRRDIIMWTLWVLSIDVVRQAIENRKITVSSESKVPLMSREMNSFQTEQSYFAPLSAHSESHHQWGNSSYESKWNDITFTRWSGSEVPLNRNKNKKKLLREWKKSRKARENCEEDCENCEIYIFKAVIVVTSTMKRWSMKFENDNDTHSTSEKIARAAQKNMCVL